jgi:hypothetical protein
MNKEENKFHLVYTTEEDIKNETKKLVSEITEDKISIFSFNGESLYETGYGHNFVYGFYNEYITKTGIRATRYASGLWNIGSDDYEWKNNEFVIIPKAESHPIDWGTLSFPIVKNVSAKTLANELQSIKPKQ